MAHNEKPTGRINADFVYLNPSGALSETTTPPGIVGRIKASGTKLYYDNGTTWGMVISA